MNSTQRLADSAVRRFALLLLVLFSTYSAFAASTTTAVTSSQATITLGDTVTFTATVTGGTGTPTGLVTFIDGTTVLGSGTLSVVAGNDQATFSTALLSASASPHSVTAIYQGDSNFSSSTSAPISLTVQQRTSTTGIVLNPASVFVSQPSTATVTVTDGGSSTPPGTPDVFATTGAPATGRTQFTATLFADGLVLVAGGTGSDGTTVLQSAEVYSVSGAAFTATGNLTTVRTGAAAVLLPNGKVLVAGGSIDGTSTGALNTAELFDPNTGTFTATSQSMTAARLGATATLLNNGQVLLAGGQNSVGGLNSAELYNPATDTFTATGNMNVARSGASATLLGSGQVLIAGGSNDGNVSGAVSSAEVFDPTANSNAGAFTLVASSLSAPRWLPEAALLLNGKVLITGGLNLVGTLTSADIYDPVANTLTPSAAQTAQPRFGGTAVTLHNGMVLFAGGVNTNTTVAELYDADSDRFDATGSLQQSGHGLIALLLNNGQVLAVGLTNGGPPQSDAELYSPSFNPLGTVGLSSSQSTDTFASSCVLIPSTNTASTCTSTVTAVSVAGGLHTITATYPADAVFSGSNNTASLTVNPASTSTTVVSSANPSASGQAVTFTATVSNSSTGSTAAPTGAVQFVVDGSNFVSPVTLTPAGGNSSTAASQSISTLSVAGSPHSITANYVNADGNFSNSTGTLAGGQVVSQTVTAPPTIAKGFSPIGIQPNGVSTLTIIITNPSGNTVALQGLAFIDNLPANVTVANPSGLTNSCGGTATATAGSSSVSLTGGTVAVNSSCAVTANVTSQFTGSYLNTTGAVSSTNGGTGGVASATLGVAFPPTISKLFVPDTITQNQTSVLSFAIQNPNSNSSFPNSDVTLTGITFTDALPAGLVVADVPNINNDCGGTFTAVPGATSVTLTGGTTAPAVGLISTRNHRILRVVRGLALPVANGACFPSVAVKATTTGTFNNTTGTISANESGPGATSNTATLTVNPGVTVTPPTIAKAFGASSIPLNGTTSLTLTFGNPNSSTTLLNVGADDPLPGGLLASPNGVTGSCLADGATVLVSPTGNDVRVLGATLPANTSCSVTVNVTGITSGVQNNTTGNVGADFNNGADTTHTTGGTASASVVVVSPPSIAKAFNPTSIALSQTTSLGFAITNPAVNPVALTGVGFTDVLPSGLTVPNGSSTVCGGTLTVSGGNTISLSGAIVAANGTCSASVAVTPTQFGSFTNTTGNVTSGNGGTGNIATANLTVFPVVISPASVNFGDVDSLQPVAATVTITNNGSTAVPISISLQPGTGANANNFASATNCSSSLAANASCTVIVAFVAPNVTSAAQLGVSTATLSVTSGGNFTQQVPLSANVIDPEPQFTPSSLSFGKQAVNTNTTLTTQLKNAGLTVLNIQSIAIGGNNPADFTAQSSCPASLSPGSTCNINVTFNPQARGDFTATLVLTSNDGTTTVPLSGSGKSGSGGGAAAPLGISADSATLQLVHGGTTSMDFTVQSTADEGMVKLSWAGALPPGVTVSFSPMSTNQLPAKMTMTVASSGSAALAPHPSGKTPLYAALFPVLGIVGLALGRKGKAARLRLAVVFAGLMILVLMAGCGGTVTPPATSPGGTFPVSVTVTSATTGHSASTSVTLKMM